MFKNSKKCKEMNEEEDEFIQKVCKNIENMTDEQYENERKFHTTFEEELANFAVNLAQKKADGDIVETLDE